jgi:hypothetical protein
VDCHLALINTQGSTGFWLVVRRQCKPDFWRQAMSQQKDQKSSDDRSFPDGLTREEVLERQQERLKGKK